MKNKNIATIKHIDDPEEYKAFFDDYYENDWYIIIDKQLLGENIGREILNENKSKEIMNENGIYTTEIKQKILEKIEKTTNDIKEEVEGFVYEYIDLNIKDKED